MIAQKFYFPLIAFVVISISSCTSVPINSGNFQDMFPDTVPSNICYLKTVRELRLFGIRRQFNATGTLVEHKYIVTAAHNLYDSWRTTLVGVQVFCKDDDGKLATSVITEEMVRHARKIEHYNQSYSTDYAFLKLNSPLPVRESVILSKDIRIETIDEINVAGYPEGRLRYGAGRLIHPLPDDSTFYYDVETAKGMSGGPVWVNHGEVDLLIGIHVSQGRARAVNSELLDDFENWKIKLN